MGKAVVGPTAQSVLVDSAAVLKGLAFNAAGNAINNQFNVPGFNMTLTIQNPIPTPLPSFDLNSIGFGFNGFGASGGFVIYPNKPNTNLMRQVYSK